MPNATFARSLVLAGLAAACLCGCSPAPQAALSLTACRLPGLEREVRCGTHEVFEDRAAAAGRRIGIRVAVIPARRRAAEPDPIVVLAGGPGQGALALAPQVATLFSRLNDGRDIVLIDQRGTGQSHPLDCEPSEGHSLQALFEDAMPESMVRECLDALDADPRHYATPTAMADIDEILTALGYGAVNLWGGSYGTRAALELMRRYPGRVRTAVLDGVAPASMKLPLSFVADGEAALERLFADCAAEPACARTYPTLRADVDQLRARVTKSPARVPIEDPVNGSPEAVRLTEGVLLSGLFRPLYAPELASLLPFAVSQAISGNFNALLASNLELAGDVADNLAVGMHLSVVCSEDVPRIAPEEVSAAGKAFFGRALIDDFLRACRHWPAASLPDDYHDPVRSDVPVLILSGGIDPATPPRHGDLVAATLPNARHAVAPNLAHGVSSHGCAPRLIDRFVRSANARDLDTACLMRIPRPLFVLPLGAAP